MPGARTIEFFPNQPGSPGPVCGCLVDQRAVVEHHAGSPAVGPQPVGHDVEPTPQRCSCWPA
jgi:hypothetical protein